MNYLISIIIPAYNAEKCLPLTMRHIINQPGFEQCQIVIVDDGSVDNTSSIGQNYSRKYKNVLYVSQKTNAGASVARNIGLEHSCGKWVMFSDADDYYTDGFFDT